MTHDELLAKINDFESIVHPNIWDKSTYAYWRNALRAVVELHKPWNFGCSHCINIEGGYMSYPCPTIQAIEKELG
jgi:hypothetical protein